MPQPHTYRELTNLFSTGAVCGIWKKSTIESSSPLASYDAFYMKQNQLYKPENFGDEPANDYNLSSPYDECEQPESLAWQEEVFYHEIPDRVDDKATEDMLYDLPEETGSEYGKCNPPSGEARGIYSDDQVEVSALQGGNQSTRAIASETHGSEDGTSAGLVCDPPVATQNQPLSTAAERAKTKLLLKKPILSDQSAETNVQLTNGDTQRPHSYDQLEMTSQSPERKQKQAKSSLKQHYYYELEKDKNQSLKTRDSQAKKLEMKKPEKPQTAETKERGAKSLKKHYYYQLEKPEAKQSAKMKESQAKSLVEMSHHNPDKNQTTEIKENQGKSQHSYYNLIMNADGKPPAETEESQVKSLDGYYNLEVKADGKKDTPSHSYVNLETVADSKMEQSKDSQAKPHYYHDVEMPPTGKQSPAEAKEKSRSLPRMQLHKEPGVKCETKSSTATGELMDTTTSLKQEHLYDQPDVKAIHKSNSSLQDNSGPLIVQDNPQTVSHFYDEPDVKNIHKSTTSLQENSGPLTVQQTVSHFYDEPDVKTTQKSTSSLQENSGPLTVQDNPQTVSHFYDEPDVGDSGKTGLNHTQAGAMTGLAGSVEQKKKAAPRKSKVANNVYSYL